MKDAEKTEFDKTATWLDTGSKAFLILYGIGYFIESYYDSRFGVGYINPLRSKVGFTGLAFGLQVTAAIFLLRLEEIINNSSIWGSTVRGATGRARLLYKIPHVVTWLGECAIVAAVLIFVFVTNVAEIMLRFEYSLRSFFSNAQTTAAPLAPSTAMTESISLDHAMWTAAAFLLMTCSGLIITGTRIPRYVGASLATIGGFAFLVLFAGLGNSLSPGLFPWFLAFVVIIRLAFMLAQGPLAKMSQRRKAILFALALLAPILYAHGIYGAVSPQWGGAGEARLIIQFERDVPPFGLTSPVRLLEETDEGFYLVPADLDAADKTAVYVPRKDVREVRYNPAPK